MLPAGGCTQECSQEESAISSSLTHSPNLLVRVPAYSFEVFTSFFFFNFISYPSDLTPGCPQITYAGYDPITNAVARQLDHPGSWHMLCHDPSFGIHL